MNLVNTSANFRALREICGITQQQIAEKMGVTTMTVKRWEKGDRPVPDDVALFMRSMASEHTVAVREMISEVIGSVDPGEAVSLTYYRTQEQMALDAELQDCECGSYQFYNAVMRSAGERLIDMGYMVSFQYPDEEGPFVRGV